MKLVAFNPFTSAVDALENINAVSEGILSDSLKEFLERNLPKVKAGKQPKFTLGVGEPKVWGLCDGMGIRPEKEEWRQPGGFS